MSEINRSLIVGKPKQPFLEWARALDDESKELTIKSMCDDSTVYLIPEIWQDSDQQPVLEWCCDILFEAQLEEWWTDRASWPQGRDLKMFLEWFEVKFHSLVVDLSDEPLRIVEHDLTDDFGTGTEH